MEFANPNSLTNDRPGFKVILEPIVVHPDEPCSFYRSQGLRHLFCVGTFVVFIWSYGVLPVACRIVLNTGIKEIKGMRIVSLVNASQGPHLFCAIKKAIIISSPIYRTLELVWRESITQHNDT